MCQVRRIHRTFCQSFNTINCVPMDQVLWASPFISGVDFDFTRGMTMLALSANLQPFELKIPDDFKFTAVIGGSPVHVEMEDANDDSGSEESRPKKSKRKETSGSLD